MRIDERDFEEILALLPKENIPADPTEALQAIENFVDLVELLMRPLPLPSAGDTSFKPPSSDPRELFSPPLPPTGLTQEVQGRDLGIGFECR